MAAPPLTLTVTPPPLLSSVKVLPALAITKELALVKNRPPTVSLVLSITVRNAEPMPNVAASPAARINAPLKLSPDTELPHLYPAQM